MSIPVSKTFMANTLKIYVFPALVTILATLIWRDVTEMRTDVKMLLAQSNIDKTKIETLEKDVKSLEQVVFNKRPIASIGYRHDQYFKPEEIYDVKKYLSKTEL